MTRVSCWWVQVIVHIGRMMSKSAAPHRQREVEVGTISITVVVVLPPSGSGG
jgi:hypothetical protein